MRIIRATNEHLAMVHPLFCDYLAFYGRARQETAARTFLSARLAQQDSVILIALSDSAAASGFVQLYPVFGSLSMGRAWILNDLFVRPDARRQNVARALIEGATAMARETGASYLELATAKDNTAARTLYESLGWVRDDVFLHYTLELG